MGGDHDEDSFDHPGRKPSRAALARGLADVLAAATAAHGSVTITHRRENPRASTYLADIVRVRFADGTREDLLCKYADGVELVPPTPHRGLAYEARVYERVLAHAPLSLPRFWGSFTDPDTGGLVFVMRFYPRGMSAAQACEHGGLDAIVGWMAEFHDWGETHAGDPAWQFLTRHDTDYYRLWLDRTCAVARPLMREFPWLDTAAAAYRDRIPLLAAARPALVHGELTTRNSFWADGQIMPVDWETAAIGAAEVDLAMFTFDWDLDELHSIERLYVHRRWRGSPPPGFAERMLAARLYVAFHWIFGSPGGHTKERIRNHLATVQSEAARWGVIPAAYLIP
jgi:hypothetical protein